MEAVAVSDMSGMARHPGCHPIRSGKRAQKKYTESRRLILKQVFYCLRAVVGDSVNMTVYTGC